jgi:uncharacterized protein (DUF1330 family)
VSAFAVAVIDETRFGPEIKQYLEEIDATLTPFDGKFRVHGGPYEEYEGNWASDLVVIEFPTIEQARSWYQSSAYARIKSLRTDNTEGTLFLVEGVPDSHRATDLLVPRPTSNK